MSALCPECAHWLYGYPPCEHVFEASDAGKRCTRCGWDGSQSAYVRKLIGIGAAWSAATRVVLTRTMAVYEFRKGKTAKFWSPDVRGKQLFLRFGVIGKTGQTRLKDFASTAAAKAELARAVADKLADGYVEAGKRPAKSARPPKAALPAAKRTAMLAVAKELGTAKVVAEITLAIDDPAAFVATFENYETLEDVDVAEMPWLALIESLNEHGRLAEVDWKEAGSEVLAWLEQIGGAAARRALKTAHAKGEDLDERNTHEVLELFGGLLGAAKLALIALHKDSDSYALMVVPAARVAPLQKLARAAGERIEHFTGKDLPKLERERAKELAKHSTKHPWKALVAANEYHRTDSAVDSVLWNLNHDDKIDPIRAVLPFAPKQVKPLLEMTVAIYDQPASKLAATTKDRELLLVALRYLNPNPPENRYQRLAASAILAEKLGIKPDGSKRHQLVLDACNIWHEGPATDKQLARLPAASRDRLARLGDGMLERARFEGDERWDSALRMLMTCGDAKSLPVIERAAARAIEQRKDNEYDLDGPFEWDKVATHIKRRMRAK